MGAHRKLQLIVHLYATVHVLGISCSEDIFFYRMDMAYFPHRSENSFSRQCSLNKSNIVLLSGKDKVFEEQQ